MLTCKSCLDLLLLQPNQFSLFLRLGNWQHAGFLCPSFHWILYGSFKQGLWFSSHHLLSDPSAAGEPSIQGWNGRVQNCYLDGLCTIRSFSAPREHTDRFSSTTGTPLNLFFQVSQWCTHHHHNWFHPPRFWWSSCFLPPTAFSPEIWVFI